MSRKSLLVISFCGLLWSVAAAGTQSNASQAATPVLLADNATVDPISQDAEKFQLTQPQSFEVQPSDDICYRIRAYIFKRDDDHAPELVRSTTCGPRAPRAKNAKGPGAKLVPAK